MEFAAEAEATAAVSKARRGVYIYIYIYTYVYTHNNNRINSLNINNQQSYLTIDGNLGGLCVAHATHAVYRSIVTRVRECVKRSTLAIQEVIV